MEIQVGTNQPIAWQRQVGQQRSLIYIAAPKHGRGGPGRCVERRIGVKIGEHTELPADAVPLVRQDEAQKIAAWLAAEDYYWSGVHSAAAWHGMRADRDHWKAECEKAQAEAKRLRSAADTDRESARRWEAACRKAVAERDEAREKLAGPAADQLVARLTADRDELQRCNDRQRNGLRQMNERLREVYQERDKYMTDLICAKAEAEKLATVYEAAADELTGTRQKLLEARAEVRRLRTSLRMEMETDGIPVTPDFDPTNPDDLDQLANQLEAVNRASTSRSPDDKRCPSGLRAKAERLRQEAAREQERDAEIAAVEDAITRYVTGPGKAVAAIAALDKLRAERRGK